MSPPTRTATCGRWRATSKRSARSSTTCSSSPASSHDASNCRTNHSTWPSSPTRLPKPCHPPRRRADVTLRVDAPGRVAIDGNAAAIGRILRNLIDNAIRHAPASSTIDIIVTDGAVVRIIDQGPGFPAGFSDHAFERFARADPSRSRATGRGGLGLAIARGLVEAHGGRIWIEPDTGGQVAFQLPAA